MGGDFREVVPRKRKLVTFILSLLSTPLQVSGFLPKNIDKTSAQLPDSKRGLSLTEQLYGKRRPQKVFVSFFDPLLV